MSHKQSINSVKKLKYPECIQTEKPAVFGFDNAKVAFHFTNRTNGRYILVYFGKIAKYMAKLHI